MAVLALMVWLYNYTYNMVTIITLMTKNKSTMNDYHYIYDRR